MNKIIQIGLLGLLTVSMDKINASEVSTITKPFQASGGLVVSANGDLYVADYGESTIYPNGDKVYKVTPNGSVSIFASGIKGASGNVIGPDGLLYQSSYVDGQIKKINIDGSVVDYTPKNKLSGPVGLAFNSNKDLFIANCNNNTISKVSNGVTKLYLSSDLLSCPAGMAIDNQDNIYVTNYGNGNIIKIDSQGSASVLASTPGGASKPAGSNAHITFGNNKLYFVSSATHQVFSLSMSGIVSLVAGNGSQGRLDGDSDKANFSLPNGIDISPDGAKLYINDSERVDGDAYVAPNVIRVVELE